MFKQKFLTGLVATVVVLFSFVFVVNLVQGQEGVRSQREGEVSTISLATVDTSFTYQGELQVSGMPAAGDYAFEFRLYDDVSAGTQVGATQAMTVTVTDGLFTVVLDFGSVFDGTALWLGMTVEGTPLTPRQPLTGTPYAHYALDGPDADPSNEYNTGLSFDGINLTVTDAGTSYSANISALGDDADADPNNELNVTATLSGTQLLITDAGGTLMVDLSSLDNSGDLDMDPTNEYNTGISFDGTNLTLTDAGGNQTIDISSLEDDADADPSNELNGTATLSGTQLLITDAGGTLVVDLSSLVDDADADPTNEYNTGLSFDGTSLTVTDAGTTYSVDISALGAADDDWAYSGGSGLTGDIYHGGAVSVGTNSADEQFTVQGNILIRDAQNNGAIIVSPSSNGYGVNPELVIQSAETGTGNDAPFHISRNAIYTTVDDQYYYIDDAGDEASKIEFENDGDIKFSYAPALTGTVTFTDNMFIDGSTGYIGMGINSPITRLDVDGQMTMRDGASSGYILVSDANGTMTWTDPTTVSTAPDGDSDSTNEYNTGIGFDGTNLTVTDGNGTLSVDISALDDDNDWAYFSGSGLTGEIYHTGDVALGAITDPDGYGLNVQSYTSGKAAVRGTDQTNGGTLFAEGMLGLLNTSNTFGLPLYVTNVGVLGVTPDSGLNSAAIYGWNYDDNTENYAGIFIAEGSDGGSSDDNYGIYAQAKNAGGNNYAGYFSGDVVITNTLDVGTTLDVGVTAVVGNISVGSESTDQGTSSLAGDGFTTTPWLYSYAIEAPNERGSASTLITVGADGTYGLADEIHFVTGGTDRVMISSAGITVGNDGEISDVGTNSVGVNADLVSDDLTNFWDLGNNNSTDPWDGVYAQSFNTVSDARVKHNIEDLPYGLNELLQLRPVRYEYNNRPAGDPRIGLLAQDVLPILPEAVQVYDYDYNPETGQVEKHETEFMGIKYGELVPVLVNSVQEQQVIIDSQATEIEQLRAELEAVKAYIGMEGNGRTSNAGIPYNALSLAMIGLIGFVLIKQQRK